MKKLAKRIVWEITLALLRLIFLFSARIRVRFYGTIPPGGFILATNHISHFDPPFLTISFPRPIDWLGMKDLFYGRFLTAYFHALNVIPVDRHGRDRSSLRTAIRRLSDGHVIGIFPEGGIRDGAASVINGAPIKGGAAVLSALSGAPILPGIILGSDRLYNRRRWCPWRRAPVWMAFGHPIAPDMSIPGEERRLRIEHDLASSLVALRDLAIQDFLLTGTDLPHSPQQRMQES